MYREFFASSPLLGLPIVSLVIFIAVFALVVVRLWTFGRHSPEHQRLARMPLEEGSEERHG
jgi:hypothetical protein